MKISIILCLLLLAFSLTTLCQTNNRVVSKVNLSAEKDNWELNKYVWSHNYYPKDSKPPLDFSAIDTFTNIGKELSVTRDGEFFAYSVKKGLGLDSVVIQSTIGAWRKAFKAYDFGFFSADNKKFIFKDKEGLYVFRIGTNEGYPIKDVKTYKVPKNGKNEWLAYYLNNKDLVLLNLYDERETRFSQVSSYDFDPSGQWLIVETVDENKSLQKDIVIYSLKGNESRTFSGVKDYVFHEGGRSIVFKTVTKKNDSTVTELQFFDLFRDSLYTLFSVGDSISNIKSFCIDKSGIQVAYVIEMIKEKEAESWLWYWKEGKTIPEILYNDLRSDIDPKLRLYYFGVSFSDNDRYILFNLQEKTVIFPTVRSGVSVDVRSYKDDIFQFSETRDDLSQYYESRKKPRNYKAVINIETGTFFQLEKKYEQIKCLQGDYAVVCKSGRKVYEERFWEKGYVIDSNWLVSLRDGSRKLLSLTDQLSGIWFSPGGHFLLFRDAGHGNYSSFQLSSGRVVNISSTGKLSINRKNLFEIAQWLPGDSAVWVYENYDIYQFDLTGKKTAVNLTNGYGEKSGILFNLMNSGYGEPINPYISTYLGKDTLLLRAFNKKNKFNGFFRKILGQTGKPEKLFMGPCFISMSSSYLVHGFEQDAIPIKADDADIWIVKKQTPTDAPNYFLTRDFITFQRLTNLQPHEKYNWLTTELHNFKRLDGTVSQGVLYKPENFDPTKKYPVIISFYTSLSDRMYQYPTPSYLIQPSIFDHPAWMVSHGYLVFTPDINFGKEGWGPGVVNTMDGAAKYLGSLPYVDKTHIGAAGHSNSGRFGYYLYTHSKSFAAIALGSGGGGIDPIGIALSEGIWLEWAEETAMGGGLGELWNNKAKWIDHTALVQLDKASSPLLCFFNKKDWCGARQAEELIIGLRRLGKVAWWLQYDREQHFLIQMPEKKDFTTRYTQFFDHYLKGAPAPSWMTVGISASMKGIETGYGLDPAGNCGMKENKCKVCNKWNEQFQKTPEMFSKPLSKWHFKEDTAQKPKVVLKATKSSE
jgi:dipeptidyl aminopeptidase/acylaminoacyl peptidase